MNFTSISHPRTAFSALTSVSFCPVGSRGAMPEDQLPQAKGMKTQWCQGSCSALVVSGFENLFNEQPSMPCNICITQNFPISEASHGFLPVLPLILILALDSKPSFMQHKMYLRQPVIYNLYNTKFIFLHIIIKPITEVCQHCCVPSGLYMIIIWSGIEDLFSLYVCIAPAQHGLGPCLALLGISKKSTDLLDEIIYVS